ncbi:hypothetical protein V6N13_088002 [Hibiscus sabdariffa]
MEANMKPCAIIAVADKEDVEKTEYELKQDAEVTDDVESELGLKDGGEGIDTSDPFTLCLELETRFCRLEKRFARLMKQRFFASKPVLHALML